MSMLFGYELPWLHQRNGIHTAEEINHQPKLWRILARQLSLEQDAIHTFLQPLLEKTGLRIIFTGAGTSAFVGDAVAPFIRSELKGKRVESIPSTDLVSNPTEYLDCNLPTLLVSFARSGNSPESLAAVALVDELVTDCYHLFLTCNPDGRLAQYAQNAKNAYCMLMPEGSNDHSFAMTSSFSCMLMSALVLFDEKALNENLSALIDSIATSCELNIKNWQAPIKALAAESYERLIVLGSGGFSGLAREASLKSLELSAGKVMTAFDSSLGFRHGPKFTINDKAVVIQFLSNNAYTRQYDIDLFNEISRDKQAFVHLAISALPFNASNVFELDLPELCDKWLCFPFIVFCQMLAFEKSLHLGLGPDNPCPTGEVNRVVQGVTIYPFNI